MQVFHHARPVALVAALAAASIHSAVFAAQQTPPVLERAVGAGVKVVKQFPATSGLTGWVLSQGGRHSIAYTTADGKTLLAGMLIDERGQNLSAQHEDMYVPKPDFAAAFAQLEKSAFIAEGTVKHPKSIIYAFVDANCPYCHFMWRAVQPYQAAGLQVRWIPVATLGPTSMPKALEVLAAADKTAAFRRMEQNHGKPWKPAAGMTEQGHPSVAASIRRNGELMESFGIAGTPGVVWRDKEGKVQVKSGMPRLSELPSITGLPEQRVTDPSLAKFK
nr:thiol:disulfide interchange protein DsbG [Massilia sp. MS-15]